MCVRRTNKYSQESTPSGYRDVLARVRRTISCSGEPNQDSGRAEPFRYTLSRQIFGLRGGHSEGSCRAIHCKAGKSSFPFERTLEWAQHEHSAAGTHPRRTRCIHQHHWPPTLAHQHHCVTICRPHLQPRAPQRPRQHHQQHQICTNRGLSRALDRTRRPCEERRLQNCTQIASSSTLVAPKTKPGGHLLQRRALT